MFWGSFKRVHTLKLLFDKNKLDNYEQMGEQLIAEINTNYKKSDIDNYKYNIKEYCNILRNAIQTQVKLLQKLNNNIVGNGKIIVDSYNEFQKIHTAYSNFQFGFSEIPITCIVLNEGADILKLFEKYNRVFDETIYRLYPDTEVFCLLNKQKNTENEKMEYVQKKKDEYRIIHQRIYGDMHNFDVAFHEMLIDDSVWKDYTDNIYKLHCKIIDLLKQI